MKPRPLQDNSLCLKKNISNIVRLVGNIIIDYCRLKTWRGEYPWNGFPRLTTGCCRQINFIRGGKRWPGRRVPFPKPAVSFMAWHDCWAIFLPSAKGPRLQQSELGAGLPERPQAGFWVNCLSRCRRLRGWLCLWCIAKDDGGRI